MSDILKTIMWYGKTLFWRTSLKSGTTTAVPAVPAAPPCSWSIDGEAALTRCVGQAESQTPWNTRSA